MREIKIKFWNGEKMSVPYEVLDLLYEGCPSNIADVEGNLDTNPKKLEKIVQLQFTGLLDKNGKEIYEADIVKFGFPHSVSIGNISWDKNNLCWEMQGADMPATIKSFWSDRLEVIGDIYTTPELLK